MQQQINEILESLDIERAEKKGFSNKRKYSQENGKKKIDKPKRARFKMMVYFQDGNRRMFHSLDFVRAPDGGKAHIDEFEGLNWLMNCIRIYIKEETLKTAQIYVNLEENPDTSKRNYNTPLYQITERYIVYSANVEFKLRGLDSIARVTPFIKKVVKERLYV